MPTQHWIYTIKKGCLHPLRPLLALVIATFPSLFSLPTTSDRLGFVSISKFLSSQSVLFWNHEVDLDYLASRPGLHALQNDPAHLVKDSLSVWFPVYS